MTCFLKNLKKGLKMLDTFGRPYLFEEDDLQKFKTLAGGIFTFIITVCVIVIGFIFGQEIYERKAPKVTSSDDIASIENTIINATDIPVIVTFHVEDGTALKEVDRILQFGSSKFCFDEDLNLEVEFYPFLVDCVSEKFGIHERYVNKTVEDFKKQGHNPKCLNANDEFSFKNKYTARNSCFLEYEVKMCDTSRDNHNCHPDLIQQTNQIYVTARILSSYVNPRNYTNPIVYYEETISTQIGNQFLKRTYFRYAQNILESDDGWIIENKQSINYISLKNTQQDINPIVNGIMYWMDFESPPLRHKSVRIYIKIQELIATIGGLFSGLYIVATVLTYSYVKFEYYLKINKHVFSKYSKDKDNSMNLNEIVIAENKIQVNNFVPLSKSHLKNKIFEEISNFKINKPPVLNEQRNIENIRVDNSPSFDSYENMYYLSYVFMIIFSFCSYRYKDKLLRYSKSLNFSRKIISFNNYILISNKIRKEEIIK